MSEEHFRAFRLSLSREEFRRLPRNSAYKYEWIAGEVWLSPRARWYHAQLDLSAFTPPPAAAPTERARLRPLQPDDWEHLPSLFSGAFRTVQPYASLDDEGRLAAARQSLEQTRTGVDGPLIEAACHVALDGDRDRLCGVILPTLIPLIDLSDLEANPRWQGPPPAGAVSQRLGQAHLTWVFVSPFLSGRGVGSILLAETVRTLLALGFNELATTFLAGNDSSMLWHWRNGFRLLPHPGSWREMSKRFAR